MGLLISYESLALQNQSKSNHALYFEKNGLRRVVWRTSIIAKEEATDAGGEGEAKYEGLLWRQVEQVPELGALCFVDATFHAVRRRLENLKIVARDMKNGE